MPPLTGVAADAHGTAMAMVVPLMFFVAAESYALAVNFVPAYRDPADAFTTTEIGLSNHAAVIDEEAREVGILGDEKDVRDAKAMEAEQA